MRGTMVRPLLGALGLAGVLAFSACGSTNDEEAGAAGLSDGAASSGGSGGGGLLASAPSDPTPSGRRPITSGEVPSAGYGAGTGTGGRVTVGVDTSGATSARSTGSGSRSRAGGSAKSRRSTGTKTRRGAGKKAAGGTGTSAGAPAATEEIPTSQEAARLARISLEDLFPRLRKGDGTVCSDLYTQARVEKMTGMTGQAAIDECARRVEEHPGELYLEKIEDTDASKPLDVAFRVVVRFQVYRKTLIMHFVRERGVYKHDRSETTQ